MTKVKLDLYYVMTNSSVIMVIFMVSGYKPECQHSKECMCGLPNIGKCDYQESVTTGQTDGRTGAR